MYPKKNLMNVKELWAEGNSTYQLAHHYCCSQTTIVNRLKELGVDCSSRDTRKKSVNVDIFEAKKMYLSGLNSGIIAKELHVDKQRILKFLREIGILRHEMSEATRKKISESHKGKDNGFFGKTHSDEQKSRWSLTRSGKNHPQFGKRLPEDVREKIRKTCILRKVSVGERNPNFQDWLSRKPYGKSWSELLKEKIRDRDNRTCQVCNQPEFGEKLHVHHINYDKLNCLDENLVSLCRKCHLLTNYNRTHWLVFFKSLLNEKYNYKLESGYYATIPKA